MNLVMQTPYIHINLWINEPDIHILQGKNELTAKAQRTQRSEIASLPNALNDIIPKSLRNRCTKTPISTGLKGVAGTADNNRFKAGTVTAAKQAETVAALKKAETDRVWI
jgi:hypothetical protein